MNSLRRRLRVCAVVWLVCQTASLAALVPRDCCAAHRDANHRCDEATSADRCTMRGHDGQPCPMHRSAGTAKEAMPSGAGHDATAGHHDHAAQHLQHVAGPAADDGDELAMTAVRAAHSANGQARDHHAPSTDCRLVAACDGPMAALLSLLANHGILPSTAIVAPESDSGRVSSAVPVDVRGRFQPPDPPPPRS